MRILLMLPAAMLLIVGCAKQRVTESLAEATVVEGRQFAAEMATQSPFETVEIRWSDATKKMEQRNRTFLDAKQQYQAATAQKPEVGQMTGQLRRAVTTSVGGALSPGALIAAMRNPAVQVPKQLASLSTIKDVPHSVAQSAWQDASNSVDADLAMRTQRVKLQQLLRKGDLIEREMAILKNPSSSNGKADAAYTKGLKAWRLELKSQREKWLDDVRDMFDAEYHDVRFIRDTSGLPTYAEVDEPDLGDWHRWCRLAREKELIDTLSNSHAETKPALPGTNLIGNRLSQMVGGEDVPEDVNVRDGAAVRREVRNLVQNWRRMKLAQKEAEMLESQQEKPALATLEDIHLRQRIFKSRAAEIESVGVIWKMDEKCWE